jgi:hypothetical protein
VTGEIDIDSHEPAAFSEQDEEFLEKCAAIVGRFMERDQASSSDSSLSAGLASGRPSGAK